MAKGYLTVDVTTPINGRIVMTNVYWLCKDNDPKQAIFFNSIAQCNAHQEITERLKEYTEQKSGWTVGVVFFDVAYRPNVS